MKQIMFAAALSLIAFTHAMADNVSVVGAKAALNTDGTYSFDVTLLHADTGWDHYANAWSIIAPDGAVLGTRTLFHPHVDEQPFTRSLSGIKIPAGIKTVTVVGVDSVHGTDNTSMTVDLPGR